MKTKKEIFNWWRNNKINKSNLEYQDFYNRISGKEISIIERVKGEGPKQEHYIILMSHKWKTPLFLYFKDLKCVKIKGF